MNIIEQMELLKTDRRERNWVLDWLANPRYLVETLSQPSFDERKLLLLMKYELVGSKRLGLLKRLHARFGKLRQKREWDYIKGM